MTNNPTIDGVPRELLERIAVPMLRTADYLFGHRDALDELRALLAAPDPIVEADGIGEPVGYIQSGGVARFLCKELFDPLNGYTIPVYSADQLASLQSTITQLQGRIAELESARGEPVAWLHTMHFDEGCGSQSRITVSPENAFGKPGLNYDALFRVTFEPLFTAPPAPVSVVLPERISCSVETPADRFRVSYVTGWNACLDATAARNELKS